MARSLSDRPDEAGARPPLRLLSGEPATEVGDAARALEARRLHPSAAHLADQDLRSARARLRVVPGVAS